MQVFVGGSGASRLKKKTKAKKHGLRRTRMAITVEWVNASRGHHAMEYDMARKENELSLAL